MTAPSDISRSRRHASKQRDGYLLVEVLATMTISAMVLVGLVSVMGLVMRASERTSVASQKIEETRAIISALSRDIAGIIPIRWAGANAGFVFEGTEHGIVFADEIGLPDGTTDNHVVLLQGKGRQLTRSEVRLLAGYQNFNYLPANSPRTLLQNRYTVRFAYFSRLDNGQEALLSTWTRTDQLPVAVRVSLLDDAGQIKAATRIAVNVDAELGCAAPGQAACGMFKPATTDDQADAPTNSRPVDADDSLGWMRYAQ